ncbi:hypothetical protein D3C78_1238500 [compost metagenome]
MKVTLPIGRLPKVPARISSTTKWPLKARNISRVIMYSRRAKTMVLAPLSGAKKVAKARPICRPMKSPAAWTTAKVTRMVRPMAMPINNCSIMMPSPAQDTTGVSGSGGRPGATTTVISAARPILAWLGTLL